MRRVCEEPWAPHPNYWAVAVDYRTGQRVALGSSAAPAAELADAVAASCAIPGFFRAVQIAGRRYVDGGLHSASNLDVLARKRLDLVIALNPMSSLHASAPRTLGERLAYAVRQASGRRLGTEAKRLRDAGTEVVLIQPTVHDLDAMGTNLMSRSRRQEVIRTAVRSVTEHLSSSPVGERLADLPRGSVRSFAARTGGSTATSPSRELGVPVLGGVAARANAPSPHARRPAVCYWPLYGRAEQLGRPRSVRSLELIASAARLESSDAARAMRPDSLQDMDVSSVVSVALGDLVGGGAGGARGFSQKLNPNLEAVALEGAHASVIGGAPAAAVVFAREVEQAAHQDERID